MADPIPNLSLDELRKAKKDSKRKSPPGNKKPEASYSDISDDESDKKSDKLIKKNSDLPSGSLANIPANSVPFSPFNNKQGDKNIGGPAPGTVEYQKMLQAYGFPPFPYPIPPGMDPNFHVQLLASDPSYKNKYDKDRSEKEKAFKEQIDRDNREKDRKAAVNKPPEDLRKLPTSSPRSMISVKPEFNVPKTENKDSEGSKPTMETRGPPPQGLPYGYPPMHMPPRQLGLPYEALAAAAAGLNPLSLLSGGGSPYGNPYLPPHMPGGGIRPPNPPGGSSLSPAELLRSYSAAAGSTPPTGGSGPEDLSRNVSVGPSSGGSRSSTPKDSSKAMAEIMQQQALAAFYPHKIRELSAAKSPNEKGKEVPSAGSSPNVRKGTPSPAAGRSRSPPPLRHVHTHTHTHFGIGYPLIPGAPPNAHTQFPPSGYPGHLMSPGSKSQTPGPPSSTLPGGFPPPPPK